MAVVGGHDGSREVEKCGAGVGNGVDAAAREPTGADSVSVTGEFPEAVGRADGDVGDATGVLRRVNETEIVGSWGALLQVGSEDWRGELRLGV